MGYLQTESRNLLLLTIAWSHGLVVVEFRTYSFPLVDGRDHVVFFGKKELDWEYIACSNRTLGAWQSTMSVKASVVTSYSVVTEYNTWFHW